MNPDYLVGIIALICVGISAAWIWLPRAKKVLEQGAPLLSLISSFVALLVFVQFYQEARKAAQDRQKERQQTEESIREKRACFNSRLTALAAELINNLTICNLLKDPSEKLGVEIKIPTHRLQTVVLESLLADGSITHHKLRARLLTIQQRVEWLNRTLEAAQRVYGDSRLAPDDARAKAEDYVKRRMSEVALGASDTREKIATTQAFLEEFWNEPERFNEESYLREKLIDEGLME